MFIVKSKRNPNLILCKDGQFHPKSMIGVGGFQAKKYKYAGDAKRACNDKPVIVCHE